MTKREKILFIILGGVVVAAGIFYWYIQKPIGAMQNTPATLVQTGRSVNTNTYNSWSLVGANDLYNPTKLEEALKIFAKHNIATWGESAEQPNLVAGWDKLTTQSLRNLNPNIRTFAYYHGGGKARWEGDWEVSRSGFNPNVTMVNPIPWYEIESNNWWLRDGDGNVVKNGWENNNVTYLDLGKHGIAQSYANHLIKRLAGRGFEGVIIDYLPVSIKKDTNFATPGGYFNSHPMPPAYADDEEWYNKAYVPFISLVFDRLHSAGYKVVSGGIPYKDVTQKERFIRSKVDIVTYEYWAIGNDGDWFDVDRFYTHMDDFANDNLEAWLSDFPLRDNTSDYERKSNVSLAAYYLAIPRSQDKRSYNQYFSMYAFWLPIWDFNIGIPAVSTQKLANYSFWSRRFSAGLVLLNFDTRSVNYDLGNQNYIDYKGNNYSGQITLPEHTALILKWVSTPAPTPTPPPIDV